MNRRLAIDIGNTRTKFAIFEERELLHSLSLKNDALELNNEMIKEFGVTSIIMSSVNAEAESQLQLVNIHKKKLMLHYTTPLPFVIEYESPETLEATSISDSDIPMLKEKGTDENKELDDEEINADSVSGSDKLKNKKSKKKKDGDLVVSEEASETDDLEPIAIEESSSPEDMLAGFDLDNDDTKK